MRTKLESTFYLALFSVLLIACSKDSNRLQVIDDPLAAEPIEAEVAKGTVSFVPLVKDVIDVQTGKAPPTLDEVLTGLNVQMSSFDANVTIDQPYSSIDGGVIELPAGYYEFIMYTGGGPLYAAEGSFTITEGVNTDVPITLNLLDLAVTINFDSEIVANYPLISAEAQTTNYIFGGVSGATLWAWSANENGQQRYFEMDGIFDSGIGLPSIDSNNSADLTITLIAPSTGGDITVSKTYVGVSANQHYNITIIYTSPTTVTLVITLGDEEVIEDTINFPS